MEEHCLVFCSALCARARRFFPNSIEYEVVSRVAHHAGALCCIWQKPGMALVFLSLPAFRNFIAAAAAAAAVAIPLPRVLNCTWCEWQDEEVFCSRRRGGSDVERYSSGHLFLRKALARGKMGGGHVFFIFFFPSHL